MKEKKNKKKQKQNNIIMCDELCSCKTPAFLALLKPLQNVILSNDAFTNATVPHLFPVKKDSPDCKECGEYTGFVLVHRMSTFSL